MPVPLPFPSACRYLLFGVGVLAASGWGGVAEAQTVSRAVAVPPEAPSDHPLEAVRRFANEEYEYLNRTVQNYACQIVKRERIDGVLQAHQYLRARVRPAASASGQTARPLAVYLEFQAPKRVAGRRVLFVDGAFEGKMLVRAHAGGITLRIGVDGGLAARESTMPITSIGFHNMLAEAIRQMDDDIAADPSGENTRVEFFNNATIDNRACTAIRITHPRRQKNLDFHIAHVFVDEQSRLPVRLDYYDWPAIPGGEPPLLGEFTYRDVRINLALTDEDFDPARLGFHYTP